MWTRGPPWVEPGRPPHAARGINLETRDLKLEASWIPRGRTMRPTWNIPSLRNMNVRLVICYFNHTCTFIGWISWMSPMREAYHLLISRHFLDLAFCSQGLISVNARYHAAASSSNCGSMIFHSILADRLHSKMFPHREVCRGRCGGILRWLRCRLTSANRILSLIHWNEFSIRQYPWTIESTYDAVSETHHMNNLLICSLCGCRSCELQLLSKKNDLHEH